MLTSACAHLDPFTTRLPDGRVVRRLRVPRDAGAIAQVLADLDLSSVDVHAAPRASGILLTIVPRGATAATVRDLVCGPYERFIRPNTRLRGAA